MHSIFVWVRCGLIQLSVLRSSGASFLAKSECRQTSSGLFAPSYFCMPEKVQWVSGSMWLDNSNKYVHPGVHTSNPVFGNCMLYMLYISELTIHYIYIFIYMYTHTSSLFWKVCKSRRKKRKESKTLNFKYLGMYYHRITESQNHRMVEVGRDLCGSSSPTLLPKKGHLQQAAQDLVQAGLEYLQRRKFIYLFIY